MNIYSIQVNPRVVTHSDESCWFWESCLSIPGPIGWVRRPSRVVVEGCDEHGVQRAPIELDAYAARIFQHELDHLDGILIVDHAGLDELPPGIARLEKPYHAERQRRAFARRVYQGETLYY